MFKCIACTVLLRLNPSWGTAAGRHARLLDSIAYNICEKSRRYLQYMPSRQLRPNFLAFQTVDCWFLETRGLHDRLPALPFWRGPPPAPLLREIPWLQPITHHPPPTWRGRLVVLAVAVPASRAAGQGPRIHRAGQIRPSVVGAAPLPPRQILTEMSTVWVHASRQTRFDPDPDPASDPDVHRAKAWQTPQMALPKYVWTLS